MAGKRLLPAEQRPRVFPESAGDFPGGKEGESKQPSPARIPMGKSSWKTSSRYLLQHPRAVPCPWVFHGVLNPWISHPSGVLGLLERAGCWLGLLEEVGKAGAAGGVLRCRSLFRGRLIQRGLSWYPAGSPSHGPGSAEPKPIHARAPAPYPPPDSAVPAPDPPPSIPFHPLLPSLALFSHLSPSLGALRACHASPGTCWSIPRPEPAAGMAFPPPPLSRRCPQQPGVSVRVSSRGILRLLQSDVKCIESREDAADGVSAAPERWGG